MNLLVILISSFVLVRETISMKELALINSLERSPLVLMKKHDSSKLQLAIPHKYGNNNYIGYYYNDSVETLIFACPPEAGKEVDDEKYSYNQLLFILNFADPETVMCYSVGMPSIRKMEENESETRYCSELQESQELQTDMYEAGYWVSVPNEDGSEVQFVSVYKICYSKKKGKGAVRYTIHRIESPSLLLRGPTIELTELQPWDDYLPSILHSSSKGDLGRKRNLFESMKYYVYQFVGYGDMPNKQWELTTKFLFNYIPITKNADLFRGMLRTDIYIRLYSKKNNKPLTLYSGTHQQRTSCALIFCKWMPSTRIESFWRIIMDDNGYAIILVAQHTLKKCGRAYLCEKNRQVKTYKKGGCIYTCSLKEDSDLFQMLNLPPLKITGDLDFAEIMNFLNSASLKASLRNLEATAKNAP